MDIPRILLVDDDPRLRELLERYLTQQGFAVQAVPDGVRMRQCLHQAEYAALILDLMLPGEDGLSLCRSLRAQGQRIPIIMLTARGDEVERIIGLEMGADDYLPKPFNPRELTARLRAVLRRVPPVLPGAPTLTAQQLVFGPFILDLASRQLWRAAELIPLTSGEFALLKVLAEHARQPLARERLLNLSRGRDYMAYDRSIDVQISRLRKLLEDDPQNPRWLQTVRGFGYVLVPDAAAPASS
jgi:two-component system phosphate regulon response regulator OmpR